MPKKPQEMVQLKQHILWIVPKNKKIQLTQFHTEAKDVKEATKNLNEQTELQGKGECKVIGVSIYPKLASDKFINNKFF